MSGLRPFLANCVGVLCVICFLPVYSKSDLISVCTKLDSKSNPQEFICPESFNLAKHYCCGISNFQYCCDYEDYQAFNNLSAGIVAAIVISSLLLVAGCVLVICCCCSCCYVSQRRQQRHAFLFTQPLHTTTSTTVHQPLYVPPSYHQTSPSYTQSPTSHGDSNGYNPAPVPYGKPPPYHN